MEFPETSVIGLGALGTALTKTLSARDIPIKSVFNRSQDKAKTVAAPIDIDIFSNFPSKINELGDLIFITVSDRAIEDVASRLSKLSDNFDGYTFVHCSGNEPADFLKSLKSKGGTIASFHPLQTFTAQSSTEDFEGIYFSMQGDSQAFPILKKVAEKIGAQTLKVTSEQKSHLHAAAVMASNYLITLLNASSEIGAVGALSDTQVKEALLPLVNTTLKNAGEFSLNEALTGPMKRGDIETVKKHLALLDDQDELRKLYSVLGLHTLKIAESAGNLDESTVAKLRKILR